LHSCPDGHGRTLTLKQIETASKSDRPKVINDLNEFFHVDAEGLDEDSKREVILQQIRERSRRYLINAIVIVLFGFMAGGLTALSVAKGTSQEKTKTDPCKDLPFDQRPISCLGDGKEGK
jgi:hypothetical protein